MLKKNILLATLKQLLIINLFIATSSASSIGVPNIISPANSASIPSFVNPDKSNDSDASTSALLQHQLTTFSAKIRVALLQRNYFQLIDVDNGLASYFLVNESAELRLANESNLAESTTRESTTLESATLKSKTLLPLKTTLPDYLLIGSLSALSAGEEITPLSGTNKSSAIYSIDLAVDYKLVRSKDHRQIAAFTAAGHAGDVQLINNSNQKVTHNIPNLIQQVGNGLANEVISKINDQIENGKLPQQASSESAAVISAPRGIKAGA